MNLAARGTVYLSSILVCSRKKEEKRSEALFPFSFHYRRGEEEKDVCGDLHRQEPGEGVTRWTLLGKHFYLRRLNETENGEKRERGWGVS